METEKNSLIRTVDGAIEFAIKVVPGASRNRLAGLLGNALKVQVAAPPERGQANAAVSGLIAAVLSVSMKDVTIIRGHGTPRKIVRVSGIDAETARTKLGVH